MANDLDFSQVLALPDAEHLGTAYRAHTLGGWFAILHSDGSGIPHFSLGAAFYTVSLHLVHLLAGKINHLLLKCQ